MSEYQKDAYVEKLPSEFEPMYSHSVVVDIVEENGEIRHQIISMVFGENNAKGDAANLNQWRDQTVLRS